MNCESCRQQMLPYLYDLLEPPERELLAAHLQNCAGCQEVLKAAQEQIGMLAEAVKQDTANIVFKAPTKVTPASTAPTVLLPPPTPRRFFLLNRWALAASILLFLFAIGTVMGWASWNDHDRSLAEAQARLAKARDDLNKSQMELNRKKDQTQKEIRAIQGELDQIFKQWKKEESTKRAVVEKERVQLIIDGPKSPLAGAPNPYNFEVRADEAFVQNLYQNTQQKIPGAQNQGQGMPPVQARLINQDQKVLYEQSYNVQPNQKNNFTLPPNMPIKPGEKLAIEFQTKNADGKTVNLTTDPFTLVFPEYVTHLTTDRPLYRPGETVRFRSLTLERFSLKPAAEDFHLRFRIVGPRNIEIFNKEFASQVLAGKDKAPIKGPDGQPLRGLGVGEFSLAADLPEGQYTLFVGEVNERFSEEKRTFQVRRWQTPRFNKEVQFHRSSYGPGDQVKIQVRAAPIQGAGLGNNNIGITAAVVVDGQHLNVEVKNDFTGNDTRVEFTCTLPGQLNRGVGIATITCGDGGGSETTVRSLPIVLRDLDVEFYPEGGDLIAGVPNRVYFQARTRANKSADFEGVIRDEMGQEVARIQTLTDDREPGVNQGLGSFTFTPKFRKRYDLRIDSPIGIDRQFTLPQVKDKGVVLSVPQGVFDNDIKLTLTSAQTPRELFVGAYCRGRMLGGQIVKAPANKAVPVTLKPQAGVGGVYRITVFEKMPGAAEPLYRPRAERLIYRKSQRQVDVAIESDRPSYQPGEPVELRLQARNEQKVFVPSIALVAVVDNSVNRLMDDKTARAMPTHFLLTTEVRNPEDLENADVLLGNHPKAAVALDLLLGCQGWRRFAEQDPKMFAQRQQPGKTPIFLANSAPMPQFMAAEQKEIEKLDQKFVGKAIDLNKKLGDSERNEGGEPVLVRQVERMQAVVQTSQNEINAAQQHLRQIRGFFWQFGLGGGLLTLLFIGFFLISVGLRRLSEGGNARPWLFAGLCLLSLLFLASVIGTFTLMGEPFVNDWRNDEKVWNNVKGMWGVAPVAPPFPPPMGPEVAWLPDVEADEKDLKDMPIPLPPQKKFGAAPLQPDVAFVANLQGQGNFANNLPAFPEMPLQPALDKRILRQQGNYQLLLEKQLGRRVQLPPVTDACVVREYAHQHKPQKDEVRRDFAETLYWHPVLALPDGKAEVKFDLSDAVTRYEVLVLSHTFDGRLGANRIEITAKLPFTVEPKLPLEVTQSDQIAIPVAVSNDRPEKILTKLQARMKGLQIEGKAERELTLQANQTRREIFHVTPSIVEGNASFRVVGKTQGYGDAVERKLKVVADGFPIMKSISGVYDNVAVEHAIELPEQWIPGSLSVQAHFYPSPLAELQNGLESMLREPAGCFEQSSSSNYPNVLILNYMKQPGGDNAFGPVNAALQPNPLLEKHSRQLLASGYRQLTNFECADAADKNGKRGFEWFGGAAPPHEALTAYGLLQFRDMAKIHPVDEAMLRRTEKYLLDQRDGKGGFKRNPSAIDQFGRAPEAITNAYIVWALTESGVKENLDRELAALNDQCKTQKDPYFLALVAMSHLNAKKTQRGVEIMRTLQAFQADDGQLAGAKTSITGSQGRDLAVETTSLAILGWLKAERPGEFNANLQRSLKWLGQQRQGQGGYGGTQATILALKAMLLHAQKTPHNLAGGEIQIGARLVEPGGPGIFDPRVTNHASLSPRSQDPITVILRETERLVPGKNVIHLNVTAGNTLPYTFTWSYRTFKPANDPKAPVKVGAKLGAEKASEGGTVKLHAVIENVSGKGQGMAVAILGLPGGLSIPEDAQQLKALAQWQGDKPGKIAAWELRGRELVLYWRELAPDAKIEIDLDLICRVPGVYRGPASRAYLYYDGERRFWAEPLNIRIVESK